MQAWAWAVTAFLIAPLVAVAGGSLTRTAYVAFPPQGVTLRWYSQVLQRADVLESLAVSVGLAGLCTICAAALGVAAAVGLHRHADHRLAPVLGTALLSPLVLPTVVTGVALLQFYAMVDLDAPLAGLLAGHVVITVPYVLRTTSAALQRLDPALEEAAASLGAPAGRALVRVTLPAAAPGILSGMVFVFVTSFDQATLSMFLSGPGVTPLPVQLLNMIEFAVDPSIAAASTLLILASFVLVFLLQRVLWPDHPGRQTPFW